MRLQSRTSMHRHTFEPSRKANAYAKQPFCGVFQPSSIQRNLKKSERLIDQEIENV
jgi:hypothetical protein